MKCQLAWCIAEAVLPGGKCVVHAVDATVGPLPEGWPLDSHGHYLVDCPRCGVTRKCSGCDGHGSFAGDRCPACLGSGRCGLCRGALVAAEDSPEARYIEAVFADPIAAPVWPPPVGSVHWTEAYR